MSKVKHEVSDHSKTYQNNIYEKDPILTINSIPPAVKYQCANTFLSYRKGRV